MKFHWFRRQQREEEFDAEIRHHLDETSRDRIERGESSDEARANALREFGNVGLVKEVTRKIWGNTVVIVVEVFRDNRTVKTTYNGTIESPVKMAGTIEYVGDPGARRSGGVCRKRD